MLGELSDAFGNSDRQDVHGDTKFSAQQPSMPASPSPTCCAAGKLCRPESRSAIPVLLASTHRASIRLYALCGMTTNYTLAKKYLKIVSVSAPVDLEHGRNSHKVRARGRNLGLWGPHRGASQLPRGGCGIDPAETRRAVVRGAWYIAFCGSGTFFEKRRGGVGYPRLSPEGLRSDPISFG